MPQNNQQWPSNLPWNVNLFIYALTFAVDITRRADGSINRRLMTIFDRQSPPSTKPVNGVITTDITVDKSRDLWFRLFTPTTAGTSLPVIFFFHGGGFAYLSPSSKPYDDFCRRLARELSAFVVSVNYRLAPENRYPAQAHDCFDTLKFIDDTEIAEFSSNADLSRCFMAGDSAGGNLVHHVTMKLGDIEFSKVRVVGNVLIQPFFGGEERTESELRLTRAPFVTTERSDRMWKSFLPEGSSRDHPAANVFGEDVSGIEFPATMVVAGGYDPLRDWQKRYYDWLKKNGKEGCFVEYENGFHTFYVYPEINDSGLFINQVKEFMQKQNV
ncbi:alpha/beta-Hydrolases superfamily protein [Euphorbia peplus]|nr:alpha/beta-Hydrolases superfamily protein [Euphorbia peplus]